MLAVVIFLLIVVFALGYVVYVGSRRLLQFDSLFQEITAVLDGYSTDLVRMTSADIDGILTDHPEVKTFHLRNMRARSDVQSALDTITEITPRRKKAPALPRPDME